MNITDFFVTEDISSNELLQKMDDLGYGMLLIGEQGKLDAIVTDGDIRRYILIHGDITDNIKKIANYCPKTINIADATEANIKSFMVENRIKAVPVIDNIGNVRRIEFANGEKVYQKIFDSEIEIVIMAGGKGTRLAPLTDVLPKPLIPVGDRTIIEHIIARFGEWGYRKFNLIVNYKKEIIKAFFSEGIHKKSNDISIKIWEENVFLGTAGGLKLLEDKIQKTFILSNCDILVDADYTELLYKHKESKNIITMVVAPKKITIPYGTIETDQCHIIKFMREKPTLEYLINTGVYVVEPQVIHMIQENEFINFTDIIQKCIDEGHKVGTYEILEDGWMDMGELSELNKMERCLE